MSVKTRKVLLSDFRGGMSGVLADRLLPLSYASLSYNFDNSDGALKDGIGLSAITFPNGFKCQLSSPVKAVYYYKRYSSGVKDALLIYCQDKCVYAFGIFDKSGIVKIDGLEFEDIPVGVSYNFNGKDIFLFSTQNDGLYLLDGLSATKIDAPLIKSMCIHNERLFITTGGDGTRLYYSDDFNPLNFSVTLTEGGYIDFQDGRGGLQKLVSSLGYLYIFRSYGISRLASYFDQTDFSVSHLFVSTGKIYPDSVTACSDGIIFLASDGLYKLTASGVGKIFSSYDAFLNGCDNSMAKGLYFSGKFFLNCKMLLNGKQESVVLVCDLTKNTSYLSKNLKVQDFCVITAENFCSSVVVQKNRNGLCTFDNLGNNCGQPLTKVWETPVSSLGVIGKEKTIKRIEVSTNVDLTVTIISEKETKKIRIKKGKGISGENLSARGKEFKFIFSTNSAKCQISSPQITFSYL